MTQMLIWHDGEQGPAIMSDAFPYGAGQLIVGPIARTGFWIGRNIRRHDSAREIFEPHLLTNTFATRQHRAAMGVPVMQLNGSPCIRWKR